jgi:hypothetical protein
MTLTEIVADVESIVSAAMDEAREHATGAGPEPDSQRAALRILHVLTNAVRTDVGIQRELLQAIGAEPWQLRMA